VSRALNGPRCGAAAIDSTPTKNIGMAGPSHAGKLAKGASAVYSRALLLAGTHTHTGDELNLQIQTDPCQFSETSADRKRERP
jgi:hypothetical protein